VGPRDVASSIRFFEGLNIQYPTGKAEKIRFLNIAQGSLEESRYYLVLARTSTMAMFTRPWLCWWRSVNCWRRIRRPFWILTP